MKEKKEPRYKNQISSKRQIPENSKKKRTFRQRKKQKNIRKKQVVPVYISGLRKATPLDLRKKYMAEEKKIYDLEERTAKYAERVRNFCLKLPKNPANNEYVVQLLRSGSSPGANYIEANEGIGGRDFIMKIKTCRREAKESAYWLRLIITDGSTASEEERAALRQEAKELVLIFTAILKKRGDK